jgi:carotenoid cleavage dioxygenase-like enzyme
MPLTPVFVQSACPTGQFPEWLQGSFLRLGPGKFDIGDFVMNHWFDGYAVIYKFDMHKGKVSDSRTGLLTNVQVLVKAVGNAETCVSSRIAGPDL